MDLGALVRRIVAANVYMVLGTADRDGTPWVSPVFFATADCMAFYWISSPGVVHSQNITVRPEVSIVVFDSTVVPGSGEAVYMAATAREVIGADIEPALAIYPGPAERGGRPLVPADVQSPGPYRLYVATVSEHSVLCPRPAGQPCAEHRLAFDHRTIVTL
jgi:hypothetical protein